MTFTDDGDKIVGVGEGDSTTRANCVTVPGGNQVGTILGHTDSCLTGFVTPKPFTVISGGVSNEILKHPGVPFKG